MFGESQPEPRVLSWRDEPDGIHFSTHPVSEPDSWGSGVVLPDGRPARVGPLVQSLDEGTAEWAHGALRLPHRSAAALTASQLAGVGLPPACPYALLVESGQYGISQPEFRFGTRFRASSSSRVELSDRTGAIGRFGSATYVLHEPQFSVLEAVDTFNSTSEGAQSSVGAEQVNARLQQIARLQELLGMNEGDTPSGATSDGYLRDFRIVVPTQFTLSLRRGSDGVTIDPELLVSTVSDAPGAARNDLAVPATRQEDFARRFRGHDSVRGSYALGGDWFVALPKPVQAALRVVKDVQKADARTRAAFASQPRQFLRNRLEEILPDEEIESVFFDGDYGRRVEGVGLWTPKVLPWLTRQTSSWVPVEECGLSVGNTQIRIKPDDIEATRQAVADAIEQGAEDVAIGGHPVPATRETLAALDLLCQAIKPVIPDAAPEPASEPQAPEQKVVLLIKDNLENATFKAENPARPGAKGTPRTLVSSLLPHQLVALHWLQDHWLKGTTGALLADDMGLGKTFETLAFICWLREQMANGAWARTPALIVAPTGLLENWRGEIAKHVAPGALGEVILGWGGGLKRLRRSSGPDTKDGIPVLDVQALAAADVVLTTYETLRDYQHSFCRVGWSLAIFDEAQKIKNPQTLSTTASKALANKASLAIALTGTPVENRMSDLWCIVDTVQPMRLGALREFVATYESNDEESVQARRNLRADLTAPAAEIPSLMMRRLKKDHLPGLPKLTVHRFEEPMPAIQAGAYALSVARAKAMGGDPRVVLRALHEMRTISLHPDIRKVASLNELIEWSARMKSTFDVLDRVYERGEKALVFLELHDVQAALMEALQQRYHMPALPFVINGEVPGDRRKKRVEDFQSRPGFDVMVLSPRAGGVGLTLTAANHVIHLARWWNPAVEDQCTDRVNRIGQTKEVHVYLPMAKHPVFGDQSFDLLLDALLQRKRAQSEDALMPPEMSDGDAEALFSGAVGVEAARI